MNICSLNTQINKTLSIRKHLKKRHIRTILFINIEIIIFWTNQEKGYPIYINSSPKRLLRWFLNKTLLQKIRRDIQDRRLIKFSLIWFLIKDHIDPRHSKQWIFKKAKETSFTNHNICPTPIIKIPFRTQDSISILLIIIKELELQQYSLWSHSKS